LAAPATRIATLVGHQPGLLQRRIRRVCRRTDRWASNRWV